MKTSFAASLLAAGLLAATSGAQLTTSRVASGLAKPLWVGSPPGDNRLFVVEQTAADIHVIENGLAKLPPFFDMTPLAKVNTGGNERGLLGLAFDPDYQNNGFFYVAYTRTGDGDVVVERYHALDADTADTGSGLIILGPIDHPQSNHNGGNIVFGPDGKLYLGMGDGGNFNDTGPGHVAGGNAQSGGTLLGKMIRVNADGSIPLDNPFISPSDGILDAIWAFGVRNPWRWSFDRQTDDLWIGDVGQDAHEEIDFQPAASTGGENYGWRCMEGFSCTGLDGCVCNAPALTLPIHDYQTHPGTCAVTGGYVYRGSAIPGLSGTYFFADYCANKIWSMTYNGVSVGNFTDRTAELAPGVGQGIASVTSFGEDNNGEVYIVDQGGEVFRIVKDPWTDLGSALPGALGNPLLVGEGGLLASSANLLRLSNTLGNAPCVLFVALAEGSLPFKGGILKPVPILLNLSFTTPLFSTLDIPFTFPPGVPANTTIVFQYAIKDLAAVSNVALSNAVKAITP